MPTLNHACPFQRFTGRVQIRVDVAPGGCKIVWPAKVRQRVRVKNSAHRVRHVCRNVYGTNAESFPSLQAFSCCRFKVDCSMCPLAVGAENTHGDSPPCAGPELRRRVRIAVSRVSR